MKSYNAQFDDRGMTNRNLLLLAGNDLQLIVLCCIVLFVLNAINSTNKYMLRLRRRLKYSMIIRTFLQAFLKICIALFINIGVFQKTPISSAITSFICFALAFYLLFCPFLFAYMLAMDRKNYLKDKQLLFTYSPFVQGFKCKSNYLTLFYYPWFLLRRFLCAPILVFLTFEPYAQLSLIIASSIIVILIIS